MTWDGILSDERDPSDVVLNFLDTRSRAMVVKDHVLSRIDRPTTEIYKGIKKGCCLHNLAVPEIDYIFVSISPGGLIVDVNCASFT